MFQNVESRSQLSFGFFELTFPSLVSKNYYGNQSVVSYDEHFPCFIFDRRWIFLQSSLLLFISSNHFEKGCPSPSSHVYSIIPGADPIQYSFNDGILYISLKKQLQGYLKENRAKCKHI